MGYVDWMVVLYQGGFSDLEGCLVVRQECLCLGEIHTGELRSHGWGGVLNQLFLSNGSEKD